MQKEVHISTDKNLLNIDFIHDYMVNSSYWAKERTLQQTRETVEHSLCFGMYLPSGEQIGFARIVTDYVFYGNLMDVLIKPEHQNKGLGKQLIARILAHETVKNLQTITLKTKDAHRFYAKYGFVRIGTSALYMAFDRQKLE